MIYYLRHKEINLSKWDKAIDKAVNSNIFSFYWFLNLATDNKWDAVIVDDYDIVVPVPFFTKFNNTICYLPRLIPVLGFYYHKTLTSSLLLRIIESIKANVKACKLSINKYNSRLPKNLLDITAKDYYILDLIYGYQQLYRNFTPSVQSSVAQINREGYYFNNYIDPKGIIKFLIEQNYFDDLTLIEKVRNILLIAKDKHRLGISAIYDKYSTLNGVAVYLTFKEYAYLFLLSLKKDIRDKNTVNLLTTGLINNIIESLSLRNMSLVVYPKLLRYDLSEFYGPFGFKVMKYYDLYFNQFGWLVKKLYKF